ncbi:MAG TPA: asparaginase [Flavobacteriaceae bacterium]|nr:asparaginase [Flavobacteriaceae bacterium]
MKRIKIFSLGGTISASVSHQTDYKDYKTGAYGASYWKETLPELENIADIDWQDPISISSAAITGAILLELREQVQKALLEEAYDAVVITQGTSTLEETAYFLHLSVATKKPIVLTGAQRPSGTYGSDARSNLLQAVEVACSSKSVGKGALVVFNSKIYPAREVVKTDTYTLESFQSPNAGPIGQVQADGNIVFFQESLYKHTLQSEFSSLEISKLPKVEMLLSYPDASAKFLELIASDKEIQGVILLGVGAGLPASTQEDGILKCIEAGKIVVRASRCNTGEVLPTTAHPSDKFLAAGNLSPQKARILLQLALCKSKDLKQLQKWMQEH